MNQEALNQEALNQAALNQAGVNQAGVTGDTLSREVVVSNRHGLHARPAALLTREARRWQSRIELVAAAQRVDGKSILDVLTLAAEAGTRLVVEATGPDAQAALEAIGSLFERRFDEHDEPSEPNDS
jgi:phosphotransferase system HPr (HPr) family protein